MKPTQFWGLPLCLILLLSSNPTSAQVVRGIFSRSAQGHNGSLQSVEVWPGFSTAISFLPVGEVVRVAQLSDPSRISLSADSALTSQSEAPQARVLFLRQITPLTIPGITRTPTGSTLLSVITEVPGQPNSAKLYQFEIIPASGKAQYTAIAIQPDSQGTPLIELSKLRRARIEEVELGLSVANQKDLVIDDTLHQRVQIFTSLVRNGETIANAAQKAGLSMAVITQLAEWGYQQRFGEG